MIAISNLVHSRLIACYNYIWELYVLGFISGLRAIKMIKEKFNSSLRGLSSFSVQPVGINL